MELIDLIFVWSIKILQRETNNNKFFYPVSVHRMQGQPRITTQKQQGCRVRKRVILGANHEDRYRH